MLRKNFKIFQVSTFCTTWCVLNCAELRQKMTKTAMENLLKLHCGLIVLQQLLYVDL